MADSNTPDINQVVAINELNLQGEMATCPAWYFYYASLHVEAEQSAENASLALETYESELAENIKKAAALTGDELTQTEIKRKFRADEKWQLLKQQEQKLNVNAKIMEKATKAIEMKSRMLTSMNRRDLFKRGQITQED